MVFDEIKSKAKKKKKNWGGTKRRKKWGGNKETMQGWERNKTGQRR